MNAGLQGRITGEGEPIAGAEIQVLGGLDTLGADPRAASHDLTAVTWSRPITGYEGNTWNCWQKVVEREVAGITWEEFSHEIARYNPSLRDTDGLIKAENTYLMPQIQVYEATRALWPEVAWDRRVTGFEGDRWACWKRHVRTKVAGVTWEDFKQEVGTHNPHLAEDGYHFAPTKSYLLPRNPDTETYKRVTYTDAQGSFRFLDLPPGAYRLQVFSPGFSTWAQDLEFSTDRFLDLELERVVRAVARAADPFVRVHGDQFIVNGQEFRFVGVNLRGLVHYGADKPVLEHSNKEDRKRQLAVARRLGARVVRVFLAASNAPPQDIGERLAEVLELLEDRFRDMYLILCFTDLYINTPFHPKGDDRFYREQPDGFTILDREWFEGGYQENYLPLVEHIVRTFHWHPQIFAWEIGNELKVTTGPTFRRLFIKFNHDVARFISDLDPSQHLITTGMLSTKHAGLFFPGATQLYGSPHISFVTNHIYNGGFDFSEGCRQGGLIGHGDDSSVAKEVGKPFIIEEAGHDALKESPSRRAEVSEDMRRWFDEKGARGYMQWGFMSGGDIGDGDGCRGMDESLHSDWDDLFRVYQDRARFLGTPIPD